MPTRRTSVAATPPFIAMLDLPNLGDDDGLHAPLIAVISEPWPISVSVWNATANTGFELNVVIEGPAVIGQTMSEMLFASSAVWDRGTVLRVKLASGSLSSVDPSDLLNGANLIAIGDPDTSTWEIFQFSKAELVQENTYDLSILLRGLFGTDSIAPSVWPVASLIVLLGGALQKITLPISLFGLERIYRVGASELGASDMSVATVSHRFSDVASRPYSISHLEVRRETSGEVLVDWIRRTRIDGDRWHYSDVPLGENDEVFAIRVVIGGQTVRQEFVSEPRFIYSSVMQIEDGASGLLTFEVSQVSSSFGPGPVKSVSVNI